MKFRLFSLLAILLLLSSLGFAGTACATPTIVPADGRIVDFDFVAASGANFYQVSVSPNHSYSIEVRQDYDDLNTDLTVQVFSDGGTCSAALTPGTNPGQLTDTTAVEPAVAGNTFRSSVIVPAGSKLNYAIKVTNANAGTGRYISVSVAETTMYSANFFTGSNYSTSYSFNNTTSAAITGKLQLLDSTSIGTVDASSTITMPAGAAALVNTVGTQKTNATPMTIVGVKGGAAIFAHNGPPGSVEALSFVQNFTSNPAFTQTYELVPIRQAH